MTGASRPTTTLGVTIHDVGSRTADYLEAVEHLPQGAMLVIPQASWEEYERLLDDLTGWPGVRVTYDRGRLEIASPSPEHEEYKELILRIVHVTSEEFGVPLETRGSTTWKRRSDQRGLEPDTCFYIANAHRVVGRRTLELGSDPAWVHLRDPDRRACEEQDERADSRARRVQATFPDQRLTNAGDSSRLCRRPLATGWLHP